MPTSLHHQYNRECQNNNANNGVVETWSVCCGEEPTSEICAIIEVDLVGGKDAFIRT